MTDLTMQLETFLNDTYELISPDGKRTGDGIHFLTTDTRTFCAKNRLNGSVHLCSTSKDSVGHEICSRHNVNRVPIYIAGANRDANYTHPSKDVYRTREDAVIQYGRASRAYEEMVEKQLSYSIWGNCRAQAKTTENPVEFVSIHAWGVNLESHDALDTVLMTSGLLDYAERCALMWQSIIQAGIESQVENDTDEELFILTPAIGCGAYLASIKTDTEKQVYIELIFQTLHKVCIDMQTHMERHKVFVRLVLLDFDKLVVTAYNNTIASSPTRYLQRAQMHDGSNLQNMFDPLLCVDIGTAHGAHLKSNARLGLVNAWDTFSWIGNGGSRDASIDGWYVAGWGYGSNFINNSYLLNFDKDNCC
jgi:hypothetical protein